tara:strand:+ start:895 stop:1143 length:249 start_codon:yes stop_codon:yes gene_type:complete
MNVHDELIHEKNDNTPQLPAIINALKLKYESEIAIAKTNIDVYLNNSVGVGEHPTIVEAVELELKKVDAAQAMLDVIEKHYV